MPQRPEAAAVTETHISYVFFVGDRAYKLKKPVRFPFIDQSTREARRAFCHREVELNRRLSPDVYLRVLDVVDDSGQPVDHVVEMRRMPAERKLSALVAAGEDVEPCLRRLAHDLAAFHAHAPTSDEIAACASAGAVRRMWSDNLGEMRSFVGPVLDAEVFESIGHRVDRYIDGRGPLFSSRTNARHARDGHGDLLADDVFCLDDGPRVLDCIEFDDRLRWGDVVADVAFLAMDLERIGARASADRFLSWYRDFSGEAYPTSLADHYVAYRASIRSKVACLKHEQGDEASRERARALLELCDRRLGQARIRLVLVGGPPGVGKSTLAAGLAGATGWTLLRSDEVRKEIAGLRSTEHAPDRFEHGIYAKEITQRTYAELLSRADGLLGRGDSVILDASWVDADQRARAREVAAASLTDVLEIRCVLDADVAARRTEKRRATGEDASDADASVARAMAESEDAWPQAIAISTAPSPEDVLSEAERAVRGA